MTVAELIAKAIDWFYIRPVAAILPRRVFRYAVCGGMNVVFSWVCYFFVYNFVLDQELLDFGFIAISPHVAAMLITFPLTFSRDSGSTAMWRSAVRRFLPEPSCSATSCRLRVRLWSTTFA